MFRTLLAAALALLALGSVPAHASTDKTPPGDPCAKDNGNPCNGNEGNEGDQGNANKERVKYSEPGPIDVPLPAVSGRAAYITQIGTAHRATIIQSAPNAYAKINQEGERHEASVTQAAGTGYAKLSQAGEANLAVAMQGGAGQNVLYLSQDGARNLATSTQMASGAVYNGAILAQQGDDNRLSLTQDGADNRAVLLQNGDGNAMTAVQDGDANRLIWTQHGDNLSNLGITQTGGGAMMVTQTGIGK